MNNLNVFINVLRRIKFEIFYLNLFVYLFLIDIKLMMIDIFVKIIYFEINERIDFLWRVIVKFNL